MFGDWEMPLQYEGTLAEHAAVRDTVGVFDVSHLGRFRVDGGGAAALVDRLLTNDLDKVAPGRTQYTLLLNDEGGIIDDIVVWWIEPESLVVLPNGVNHDRVVALFVDEAPANVTVTDLRPTTCMLAVQGPDAPRAIESAVGLPPVKRRVAHLNGIIVAGTGYTGEAGGEVIVPLEQAEGVFGALLDAGAVPCGLGARDTLRLEAGLPLWGQDLDETITPLEAGLEWALGWDDPFPGRDALIAQRSAGIGRTRVGFVVEDRRPPRHGYAIRCGESSGEVTSGNFSPALQRGIGLAYLAPPPDEASTAAEIQVRDQWVPATLTKTPFVSTS